VYPAIRTALALLLLLAGARTLAAQTSLSPTLPSDTLEANYAPKRAPSPMPDRAPTLPSDTLQATQPVDSFPDEAPPLLNIPDSAGDSAAVRELRSWIRQHPLPPDPPPVRAVLVRV
jgi:hypothetical protein